LSEGRRRAAILSREEFGLQVEGENRRAESLRPGLSGFMAAPETPRASTAWGECPFIAVFSAFFLVLSFNFIFSFIFSSAKPLHLVLTRLGRYW
jgi:hypothetical protein